VSTLYVRELRNQLQSDEEVVRTSKKEKDIKKPTGYQESRQVWEKKHCESRKRRQAGPVLWSDVSPNSKEGGGRNNTKEEKRDKKRTRNIGNGSRP